MNAFLLGPCWSRASRKALTPDVMVAVGREISWVELSRENSRELVSEGGGLSGVVACVGPLSCGEFSGLGAGVETKYFEGTVSSSSLLAVHVVGVLCGTSGFCVRGRRKRLLTITPVASESVFGGQFGLRV